MDFELSNNQGRIAAQMPEYKLIQYILSHKNLDLTIAEETCLPNKLDHTMAAGLKIVEKHLKYEKLFADKDETELAIQANFSLLNFYSNQQLDGHYSATVRKLTNQIEQLPDVKKRFYYRHLLAQTTHEIYKSIKEQNENLQKIIHNLDLFYLSFALHYYSYFSIQKQTIPELTVSFPLMEELLFDHLPNLNYIHEPVIAVYHQSLMMWKEIDHLEHFEAFKELMRQHLSSFNEEDVKNLFVYARSYSIFKFLKYKKLKYIEEADQLWNWQMKISVLDFPPSTFRNIITIKLKLGKVDDAEEFIKDNIQKVKLKHQEEIYNFNFSSIYFHKKNYEIIPTLLLNERNRVYPFSDIYHKVYARILLIKTYYELKDISQLQNIHNNLSTFLTNQQNRINATILNQIRNFISIVRRLTELPPDRRSRQESLTIIIKNINETKLVEDREWLLEKASEWL